MSRPSLSDHAPLWRDPRGSKDADKAMAALWHREGVFSVRIADLNNDIDRAFINRLGARIYGDRDGSR